ncbi:PhzF family phenazine biosynthesis protein [Flavilitoribacter nigricans]|uniref:Isomerase n=1 Tax=Flavilitoribacter nigricans (strain ATCC 23147 / DSM 23189 / NBRC 102662 / NCIMB 1420 / SS-2) TaxID=1122177 RepID=A0A2D0N992_FLAN2|nr:PhzF family phenazine biosynthesis protein [Flavilitoribacter nigricans]PHN05084.1 isomerase [Flavilitoribacter nigricans DSM 23189 = NBRC 102662]
MYKLYQVDAFTNELFGGNPAAIVPLESWLSDDVLQAIALENNLSETAFFVPEGSGFQLRWFTPGMEVDLCGHATLATAHVLFEHLDYAGQQITFQSRSGALYVTRAEQGYRMDFPADLAEVVNPPEALVKALGELPLEVLKGKEDYMAVFPDEATIRDLQPDFRKMMELGGRGVIATAPGNYVDFVSRCFFPNAGIDEDPVTGSAHTVMTPYWAEKLGKNTLEARQISARGGELLCTLEGDRVFLEGEAVSFLEGTFKI